MQNRHACNLTWGTSSVLPKLAPSSPLLSKFRKLFLLSPNLSKCTKVFRNKNAIMAEMRRHLNGPYCYVIHPFSSLFAVIEALFVIVWLTSIIIEPMIIFRNDEWEAVQHLRSYALLPVKITVIICFFNSGYYVKKTNQVVLNPAKIILRYLTTFFIFDIGCSDISTHIVWYLETLGYLNKSDSPRNANGIFYIIRVFCCLVRLHSLIIFLQDLLVKLGCSKKLKIIIIYLVRTYFYLHYSAFLIYLVPHIVHNTRQEWPTQSWLYQAELANVNDGLHKYIDTFAMAACYFFGISCRYHITLVDEEIVLILVSFAGRVYSLFLLADILTVFGFAGISERQLESLTEYISFNRFPENLKNRILSYYEFKYLHLHLRFELFLFTARSMIAKDPVLSKLPKTTIWTMVASMQSEMYSPKKVIINIGSEVDEIFFISFGAVAVTNKDGTELCRLGESDNFGISCLVFTQQQYRIVTVKTTEVFRIQKDRFLELLQPHPEVLCVFFRATKHELEKYKALGETAKRSMNVLQSE